jgi:hypothetical protein
VQSVSGRELLADSLLQSRNQAPRSWSSGHRRQRTPYRTQEW